MKLDRAKIEKNLGDFIQKITYKTMHIKDTTTITTVSYLGDMRITSVTVDTIQCDEFDVEESTAIALEKCKHKTYDTLYEFEIYHLYRKSGLIDSLSEQPEQY